jgi:hypothetical protein
MKYIVLKSTALEIIIGHSSSTIGALGSDDNAMRDRPQAASTPAMNSRRFMATG